MKSYQFFFDLLEVSHGHLIFIITTGWEERQDANGRTYYVNHVARTTQWQYPGGSDGVIPVETDHTGGHQPRVHISHDETAPPSASTGSRSTANDSSFIERTHNLSIEGKDFITIFLILHTTLPILLKFKHSENATKIWHIFHFFDISSVKSLV